MFNEIDNNASNVGEIEASEHAKYKTLKTITENEDVILNRSYG